MTDWETVIGLEVHAQLLTRTKMFCRCSADYADAAPNSRVCPICLGLPGALPTINRAAVELTVRTGLALGARIAEISWFDRKNYFYPDLMKGYQISQYPAPLCSGGEVRFVVHGERRRIGVTRVHLEEDTAKHTDRNDHHGSYSLINANRSGVPLIEIVGEPELRSGEEAREYLRTLRAILRYIGACSGNMEEGAIRCDANVSVRLRGTANFGTKVEIKNMNSFRSVAAALDFESRRQVGVLEGGGTITQETRGWDDARGVTVSQRSKEYAHDYRYFPEPDLRPLRIPSDWLAAIRAQMPELPEARAARYQRSLGLTEYDARLLADEREFADLFDETVTRGADPKQTANWINGDVRRELGDRSLASTRLNAERLQGTLSLLAAGDVNRAQAQTILAEVIVSGADPAEVATRRGLRQISDESALAATIREVLASHPRSVADFHSGKQQVMGFLVGQVMKATRGKANPTIVNRLLAEMLTTPG
ncbi:MAG: Asp-tRNA(Asn)/Glu-tRNA(Gln) amidotransferase subunit GatB [Chloroflexi bacterium]|nr:Asp-tRNA(Asn)/Glu-tRNA(Gln) amidotransferase subunit GatB [Chloroflexota bacterium]